MSNSFIPGGYYIKARKIQESSIMRKAPVVRETWDWLLMNANHSDNGICKRGQRICTLKEVRDGLSWYAGYSKRTYSEKQMRSAFEILAKEGMIVTTKVTHGILVTISNYNTYQAPENYEGKDEGKVKGETRAQYKQELKKERIKNNLNGEKNNRVYSRFEFSGDGFSGVVLNYEPEEMKVLFEEFGTGTEYAFRKLLQKRDDWYATQPYKTQINWKEHTVKFLVEKRIERNNF